MVETAPRATVGQALAGAHARLAAAGCDTPRLDAELLLAEVLGIGRAGLVLDRDEPVEPFALTRFGDLVDRRERREPVAYVLGRRDFRWLTLSVDPRVLVPRPETELLVELGLELAPGARVLDVGTGSGAVALALAHERPDLRVRGIDTSLDALAVARANARRLGLDVSFSAADLLDSEPCDALLANLPYVSDRAELPPEVARFEPAAALYAGPDGLDAVRRLMLAVGALGDARPRLVGLEIGPEQAVPTRRLVAGAGYAHTEVRPDLAGHERVVVGRA